MAGSMTGKVALVTGAASGIGRAIADRLAKEGAMVAVCDLGPPGEPWRPGCFGVELDVTREQHWRAAIEQVRMRYGRLDILVNNAGIGMPGPLVDLALCDWRAVMAVNLDGAFLGIKHAVPAMRQSGGGAIVNIASMLATVAVPDAAAYSASKAGLLALTRAAALELAVDRISVNAVSPGWIDTPLLRSRLAAQPEREAAMLAKTPAGRLGSPAEVAAAVQYLASAEAAFVTGTTITLDGGYTLR